MPIMSSEAERLAIICAPASDVVEEGGDCRPEVFAYFDSYAHTVDVENLTGCQGDAVNGGVDQRA